MAIYIIYPKPYSIYLIGTVSLCYRNIPKTKPQPSFGAPTSAAPIHRTCYFGVLPFERGLDKDPNLLYALGGSPYTRTLMCGVHLIYACCRDPQKTLGFGNAEPIYANIPACTPFKGTLIPKPYTRYIPHTL